MRQFALLQRSGNNQTAIQIEFLRDFSFWRYEIKSIKEKIICEIYDKNVTKLSKIIRTIVTPSG